MLSKVLLCAAGIVFVALPGLAHAETSTFPAGTVKALPFVLQIDRPYVAADVAADHITLTAPKGSDMYTDPSNGQGVITAPRATFHADGDFIFSARVDAGFMAQYDGAALILYGDDGHWAKLLFEHLDDHTNGVTSSVVDPRSDDDYHVRLSADDKQVWLKIVRAGGMVIFYMSQDGAHWDMMRDFAFDSPVPVAIGFETQAPVGDQFTGTFTNIRFDAKTFTDFWQGE